MKHHFVFAAVAATILLAGCGASDADPGAGGQSPRLLAATGRASTASVSTVNSTDSTFTTLSTMHVGQTAYFKVVGSKLPSTLALDVTDCAGMTTLSTGATEAHYRCTPGTTAGMKTVTVRDKSGGSTLYTNAVNVQAVNPPPITTALPMPTRGFNLGNSLEAIWGYSIPGQAVYTSAANAGFNAVRIPCAWASNADTSGNIDPTYMAKVKQAVDYSIAAGMYAVINVHWDGGWFDSNIGNSVDPTLDAKYRKIWSQIATAFAGYDNHLLFAAANEPSIDSPTKMNTLMSYYQSFVNTVRAAGGGNTNRWLMLPIQGDASWITALPSDPTSGRLGVEFHNYTPSLFTIIHTDQSWGNAIYFWGQSYHYSGNPSRNATWGEEGYNDAFYQQLQDQFVSKGVPVIIGEYQAAGTPGLTGADQTWNNASRLYWNKYLSESARAHGLSPFYWSTPNAPFAYDTGAITDAALVTALTGGVAPPPPNGAPYAVTGVTATAGTGQVTVSWTAVGGATSYQLYRTANSGSEAATPSVTGITGTTFTDTGLNAGTTYYYRVVAVNGSGASGFSTEAKATTSGTNPDPTKFHFETDTQSWTPSGSLITGVATSTAQHYAGQRSLAVNFAGTAAGSSSVTVNDAVVPPGATITFRVWIPAGSQITKIEPYIQDYNWNYVSNPVTSFTPAAWNTLTLTVPTTSITPVHRLGLSVTTGAAWTGTVYIDSINW
ncbi:cellulase family glycosylhydrolase [Massilia pinisoli]|uniref:Cellulase family glycosylhydrolase n=1 Tax=Massilia pinisoli TaxID=1772194 RepID=A0ABT1ZUR9_9BURK|nr:cellulase family glycosylhydrolase [Massilia pinisoli]MCS0583652.1 cellulase family glycosylhydrolase [Massilia pinisoli]